MNIRKYFLILLFLSVLITWIGNSQKIILAPEKEEQRESQSQKSIKEKELQNKKVEMKKHSISNITIYFPPNGNLRVSLEHKENDLRKQNKEIHKDTAQEVKDFSKVEKTNTTDKLAQEGDRPHLTIAFDDGSSSTLKFYFSAIENVGKFFLLGKQKDNTGLQSAVSFLDSGYIVDVSPVHLQGLARKRPHILSDPNITKLLETLPTAFSVRGSSHMSSKNNKLVLFFTKEFDQKLWHIVGKEITKHNLHFNDIDIVEGTYIQQGKKVILNITGILKKDLESALIPVDIKLNVSSKI